MTNTFDVNVVDENGDAISGVTVELKDKDGTSIFSTTTDANGDITQQEALIKTYKPNITLGTSHFQDPDYITDNNPFTLTISKSGYETYTSPLTIDPFTGEGVVLALALKSIVPVRPTTSGQDAVAVQPQLGSQSLLEI